MWAAWTSTSKSHPVCGRRLLVLIWVSIGSNRQPSYLQILHSLLWCYGADWRDVDLIFVKPHPCSSPYSWKHGYLHCRTNPHTTILVCMHVLGQFKTCGGGASPYIIRPCLIIQVAASSLSPIAWPHQTNNCLIHKQSGRDFSIKRHLAKKVIKNMPL
jgi:hypothetical protein